MATATAKSSNAFQSNAWNRFDQLAGESSSSCYLPNFYENDITSTAASPTFRSVSPKIYPHQRKPDYFSEINEELEFGDDCDALYESTLMNSHFLDQLTEEKQRPTSTAPMDRLYQLLGHINPGHHYAKPVVSPLSNMLASNTSVRSQFSSSSAQQQQQSQTNNTTMVAISMPDPRDPKGKGKFNMPTL
jgi:hypothetical protein